MTISFLVLFNATKYGHLEFSLQKAILFIKMLKELKDNDFHVICLKTFSKCFADWITDESWEIKNIDGVDEQVKSRFIVELNKTNTAVQYNDLYKLIKKKFLKFYDVTTLNKIGVVSKPKKLPRYWSNELKNKNIKYWKDKDIDGKTIGTYDNKHAGHLISDFELSRLTDEERKKVFKEESDVLKSYGYPLITGHETNFRVISEKHNMRMNIMRMSDYHNILDTTTNENIQNKLISEKINEYEEKYKNKPILS